MDRLAPFSWDLSFSLCADQLVWPVTGPFNIATSRHLNTPRFLQRPTNIFFPGFHQRPPAFFRLLTPPPYQNKHRQYLLNHIPSRRLDRLLKLLLEGSTCYPTEEGGRMLNSMQTSSDVRVFNPVCRFAKLELKRVAGHAIAKMENPQAPDSCPNLLSSLHFNPRVCFSFEQTLTSI